MTDVKDRLRQMADLFEAQQEPHNMVLHLRAAVDEIERLRAALDRIAYGKYHWEADAQEEARAALEGK